MSEIQIDHEAAKDVCHARLAQGMHPSSSDRNIARAYLDIQRQLATANARIEKYQKRLEITHCYDGHTGESKDIAPEKRDTYPDGIECRDSTIHILNEQLAAERERADRLVTLQNMVLEGLRDRSEYQWAYAIEKQIKAILEGRDHA